MESFEQDETVNFTNNKIGRIDSDRGKDSLNDSSLNMLKKDQ